MTYESRRSELDRDESYSTLERTSAAIIKQTTQFLTDATNLASSSPTQEEQDEVALVRSSFVAAITSQVAR